MSPILSLSVDLPLGRILSRHKIKTIEEIGVLVAILLEELLFSASMVSFGIYDNPATILAQQRE